MNHTKMTVNERLSMALMIADKRNQSMHVRLANLEAAVTQLCDHVGVELVYEEKPEEATTVAEASAEARDES